MLLLRRYKDTHTEGKLIYPDDSFTYALERPWLDNKAYVSCIPEGTYIVYRDHHGKHQWYRLKDNMVAPRSAIEIHAANEVSQLKGCIAPCMELRDGRAYNCTDALYKLKDWFGENSFVLEIRKYNPFKDGKW